MVGESDHMPVFRGQPARNVPKQIGDHVSGTSGHDLRGREGERGRERERKRERENAENAENSSWCEVLNRVLPSTEDGGTTSYLKVETEWSTWKVTNMGKQRTENNRVETEWKPNGNRMEHKEGDKHGTQRTENNRC